MTAPALRLRGTIPPDAPKIGRVTVTTRLTPPEYAFVQHVAAKDHISVNRLVRSWVQERMRLDDGLPDDVKLWLLAMAAQQGYPGDWERALIATVRHLASHYPEGVRLDDDG